MAIASAEVVVDREKIEEVMHNAVDKYTDIRRFSEVVATAIESGEIISLKEEI